MSEALVITAEIRTFWAVAGIIPFSDVTRSS
jgi:hypothetical protein